jgi:hypothetical protein
MKKIIGTIFLLFCVFILGFSQFGESPHSPLDSAIVDSTVLEHSTKKELKGILTEVLSQGDSGKLNVTIINVPPQNPIFREELKEEALDQEYFNWWQFLLSSLLLLGLYCLLEFLNRVLTKYNFLGKYQTNVKGLVMHSLLIFEAVALLILGSGFVLINPFYHGILVVIVLAVGFNHLKNYFSGRIVQFDKSVIEGKRLKTYNSHGVIFKKGRFGLKLRTHKGVQFVNYSRLISDGYTLLTGIEVGGFYELEIQPKSFELKKDYLIVLRDLLTTTPYLDLSHKPQLEKVGDGESRVILARVEVKEESHLQDLVTLIKEQDFSCKVVS